MRWLRLLVMLLSLWPLVLAPSAGAAEIQLLTDATGAMFLDPQLLEPGDEASRCLQVQWTDNDEPRLLGIAADVTGGLAPYLQVQVEVGAGGSYTSCAGFQGDTIYRGTLGAFGAAHPNDVAQLSAQRITTAHGAATFRVTIGVLDTNEAQARTAAADFIFSALDEARRPVPPSPDPTPTPSPPATPGPAEPGATPPGTAKPAAPGPELDEDGGVVEPTTRGPSGDRTSLGGETRGGDAAVTVPLAPRPTKRGGWLVNPIGALRDVVDAVAQVAQRAAAPVGRGIAWSTWTLPVLLTFVALQNNIDARDPKLATAPASREPSLPFDDVYTLASGGSGHVTGRVR